MLNSEEVRMELEPVIIGMFKDDLYEDHGHDHIRLTARALAENQEGKFAFLHIQGEDYFGERNHLETCGGGMEENEELDQTLVREVREELGLDVLEYEYIGTIVDAYNLIKRVTYSSFFHCKVDSTPHQMNRTEEEQILISEVLWLDPLEALDILEHRATSKVDRLVMRRDAMALRYYLENYTDLLK